MSVPKEYYRMEEDWNGELYYGVTLKWNYQEGYVGIFMPKYVQKKLMEYCYKPSKRLQYCPYQPNPITNGNNSDEIVHEVESPPLDANVKKYVQQVLGSCLNYTYVIDMTIVHALSAIALD